MALRTSGISCERLTPALGAVVSGFDPWQALHEPSLDEIAGLLHAGLMEHQVLFIRDCDLTPVQHARLSAALGPLAPKHPIYPSHPECPDVAVLSSGGACKPDASEWHTDLLFRMNPPFASLLRAVEVPKIGGDTLWASMYSVYDSLGSGLQSELAELQVINDPGIFLAESFAAGGHEAMVDTASAAGIAVHPAVAVHPNTKRPYLNVAESTSRFIVGLSAGESNRLLTMLFDLTNRPQFHVRLKWETNTMAIWDNRGTQHFAVSDYLPNRRVMNRVVVERDLRTADQGRE